MSLINRIRQNHQGSAGDGDLYNNGHQRCCVCGKEYFLDNLDSCICCGKWVCLKHVKYKNPDGMGKDIPYCPNCAHYGI